MRLDRLQALLSADEFVDAGTIGVVFQNYEYKGFVGYYKFA